jgi:hypothetical protein
LIAHPATDGEENTATGAPVMVRWIAANATRAARLPAANLAKPVKVPAPGDATFARAAEATHARPAGAAEKNHARTVRAGAWEPAAPATAKGPSDAFAAMETDSILKGKLPDFQAGKRINQRNILLLLAYRPSGHSDQYRIPATIFYTYQVSINEIIKL